MKLAAGEDRQRAVEQFSLDVFGEVSAALSRTPEAEDEIRCRRVRCRQRWSTICARVWPEPDEGLWETRGGAQHFTHSR